MLEIWRSFLGNYWVYNFVHVCVLLAFLIGVEYGFFLSFLEGMSHFMVHNCGRFSGKCRVKWNSLLVNFLQTVRWREKKVDCYISRLCCFCTQNLIIVLYVKENVWTHKMLCKMQTSNLLPVHILTSSIVFISFWFLLFPQGEPFPWVPIEMWGYEFKFRQHKCFSFPTDNVS